MVKIDEIKHNFIKETYQDTWDFYKSCLDGNSKYNWDYVVLTASNNEQAKTYIQEINYRLANNVLPKHTKYLVVEDVNGKRVGSGGATLNVLSKILEYSKKKEFSNEKILVIHSGGDSKRIPQYSVCGKIFSPVQRELPDGRSSTLFDEFIIAFSAVPSRMSSGMVVLSGDVLLAFNPMQLDFHYLDSAAISIKSPVDRGCNHGVFLTDDNNIVKEFLHKQSIGNLNNVGAVNTKGLVDIDTGAIYFETKIINKLYELISTEGKLDKEKFEFFVNDIARLSFYGDFLYPIATSSTLEKYLQEAAEGTINKNLIECRKLIWEKLHDYKMKVFKLSPAYFIHYGTTIELFDMLTKNIEDYTYLGWRRNVLCNLKEDKKRVIYHSLINEEAMIGENVYIENSYIGENVTIGNNCIISNTELEDIVIPDSICVHSICLNNNKYVTRVYSTLDNPKVIKNGSTPFLNSELERMLEKYNISEEMIWEDKEKNIWNANLYCIEDSLKQSIKSSILLYRILHCMENKEDARLYFNKKRTSLCDSFNNADSKKMQEFNIQNEIELRSYEFINLIKEKTSINKAIDVLIKSPDIEKQIECLLEKTMKSDNRVKCRTYLAISQIIKENSIKTFNENFEDLCYKEVKKAISKMEYFKIVKENIQESAYVQLPIRVNFGGGWSDTPPYCYENGGAVINAAFKLDGRNPITVKIEKNNKVILRSIDLNVEKEFMNVEELKECSNTNDPFSLLKAALLITGIVRESDTSMVDVTDRLGTGFLFTTGVMSIPKGSGLGTSSILAGACLKAIYQFLNMEVSDVDLCYKVMEQEQLMSTGGGWQDQIGGIIPGIKFTTTLKGTDQKFNIEKIQASEKFINELNNRMVLIYTGQRRLAKNLLREVMNGYVAYNSNTILTIKQIKEKALEMLNAIKEENIEIFAEKLNEHWDLSKKLEKNCTNVCIDQIIDSCQDLICGKMICGAGGGGFLQVILKKNVKFKDIKERIEDVFQDSGIEVHKITLFEGEK